MQNQEIIAENLEILAENLEILAENREILGENREILGENREIIGKNREVIWEYIEYVRGISFNIAHLCRHFHTDFNRISRRSNRELLLSFISQKRP